MKSILATLALLTVTAGASAQTPIWGVAQTRCAAYLAGSPADPRYADWISGYVVGQAVASPTPNLDTDADMETLRTWLPTYCRAHPDDHMMSAAVAFMREKGLPIVKRVHFGAPPAPAPGLRRNPA